MAYNSSGNPLTSELGDYALTRTALDSFFYPTFNGDMAPGLVTENDPRFFKQERIDQGAFTEAAFIPSGAWSSREELENVRKGTPGMTDPKTFIPTEFSQELDFGLHFFRDQKFGFVKRSLEGMARKGRKTRRVNAFNVYNNMFTTELSVDGIPVISDTRTVADGSNVDNKGTYEFSLPAFEDAVIALEDQRDRSGGEAEGFVARHLLVSNDVFRLATQLLESTTRADQDNPNVLNFYADRYDITIGKSPFLAKGSWFLLADDHTVMRYVREDIETWMRGPEHNSNRVVTYGGAYRETVGVLDYTGIYGSTGQGGAHPDVA